MKDGEQQPAAIDVLALAARDNFARSLGIEIVEASFGRAVSLVKASRSATSTSSASPTAAWSSPRRDAAMGYASNSQAHPVSPASICTSSTACRPVRAMS